MEVRGYPSTKFSERRKESFGKTNNRKTHQFHMIKSNREVNLNSRGNLFRLQKTTKIKNCEVFFKKCFRTYFPKIFSLSRKVPKKDKKWPAIAEIKLSGLLEKWAKMIKALFFYSSFVFIVI